MELRVAEAKSSPKREKRSIRGRNHRSQRNYISELIAKVNGGSVASQTNEDGVVRVKLLVRKQDLREMLELMRSGKNNVQEYQYHPSSSLEKMKQVSRTNAFKYWTPALQSIPEEL